MCQFMDIGESLLALIEIILVKKTLTPSRLYEMVMGLLLKGPNPGVP